MSNIRREDWESLVPTVGGWGINDANYNVCITEKINGKTKITRICPYYKDWCGIIERCYRLNYQENHPTYVNCTICEEWKYLSNFIKWVDSQPNRDWQNCELDKDILFKDNKQYNSETCVYIPKKLNTFIATNSHRRGDCMIGVQYVPTKSKKNPYQARCHNPSNGKQMYLGNYSTELEAHKAWQAKKHQYALVYAAQQQDPRLVKVLTERYAPDKDWTKA